LLNKLVYTLSLGIRGVQNKTRKSV